MSYSGEAADQVIRLSLNGVEVAAKLSGSAAKQLAIMIYAILKDQKKTKGKIRLTNMLRSGKELKVFAVKDGDLQKFCEEANVALTTDGQAAAYQHGTDPLSVAAVSINLEKLKQAASEDTGTGDYVVLTEEEVYDFMRRKAQENNQNQNSNHQEETYEKHHQQYHPPHHPSDF